MKRSQRDIVQHIVLDKPKKTKKEIIQHNIFYKRGEGRSRNGQLETAETRRAAGISIRED